LLDAAPVCSWKSCKQALNEESYAEAYKGPADQFHRLFAYARGHICSDLTVPLQGVDIPRDVELSPPTMDERDKGDYSNNYASIVDDHYI